MNSKKGFTLMELLAVIVILGIIATIATPVVLNIINSSKSNANRNSVTFYGKAIDNAVKTYMASNNGKVPSGSYYSKGKMLYLKSDNTSKDIGIDYKGNDISCDTVIITKDGDIYITGCKIENSEDYIYNEGSKTEYFVYSGIPQPKSFAKDDWKTIVANVQAGNTSKYKVGDTKEITLTGEVAGTYTVRIANTSTPEKCNQEGYSQTACGFVIEFEDIITTHVMNSTYTNVGGWPASEMRTYVNDTIYESLPKELRDNIINTTVVSGYGPSDTSNFTTIDKLYLLSTKEVWGKEGTSDVINYDTAENETRQLDYYNSIGVTTSNYSGAIKQYNGSNTTWWLRSANSVAIQNFFDVYNRGSWICETANSSFGVVPAFRIG